MPKRKIRSIHIKNFRGVPTSLYVDFTKKDGKNALSTIIYGGNGSGKSTIVDALEHSMVNSKHIMRFNYIFNI